ncbi:uncharacterized oxidoreductase ZK1290.5-like [Daphnia pulex]|uniref:uncharacterized oxidoreductase ZK1290.5-like n=1 Tax=Daphnia pulex TaxID=6669 RepID=UPI001EE0E8C0|nr:uncharacterized oxidoreductase ZK1290.5-like [Daphnia pulex]
MASLDNFVRLPNGVRMPIFGLGTSHGGGYDQESVIFALRECNYRLIDTARRYGCEHLIGKAIKESGVQRESVFIATKMWPTDYGTESAIRAAKSSLTRLDTDYLDLYMMHWPLCPSSVDNVRSTLDNAWRGMERLLDEGTCRSIGVSNFSIQDLIDLMESCSVVPHVNQCEFHPYQNPKELRAFCRENNIEFQGYCPLANGMILKEPPVEKVAQSSGRSPAQVLIRWSIQNGVVTIPKSIKKERIKENCQVFDFELSPEEMAELDTIPMSLRAVDPAELQGKIDDNKPDGYKLPAHLQYVPV